MFSLTGNKRTDGGQAGGRTDSHSYYSADPMVVQYLSETYCLRFQRERDYNKIVHS